MRALVLCNLERLPNCLTSVLPVQHLEYLIGLAIVHACLHRTVPGYTLNLETKYELKIPRVAHMDKEK